MSLIARETHSLASELSPVKGCKEGADLSISNASAANDGFGIVTFVAANIDCINGRLS